jgi:hypothetical protein
MVSRDEMHVGDGTHQLREVITIKTRTVVTFGQSRELWEERGQSP